MCSKLKNDDLTEMFPAQCHFKIIAANEDDIHRRITSVLTELGINESLEYGNMSSGSKYRTFNVSLTVQDRETMQLIDSRISEVNGVRMVL